MSEDEEKNLIRIINSALPEDIIILGMARVSENFNAKQDSKKLVYRYFFFKEELDLGKMIEAAQIFAGKHNFQQFCKNQSLGEDQVAVNEIFISKIVDLKSQSDFLPIAYYECKASGFLPHQVI